MNEPVHVPPTMMERVGLTATSAVPYLRHIVLPPSAEVAKQVAERVLPFGAALLESVASSHIESIHVSVTQAALAFWQPRHPFVTDTGRAVAANIHATIAAFNGGVTYRDHSSAHNRLMRSQGTKHYAGGYRVHNVRVSDHVAPAPIRVSDLMEDLADFVEQRTAITLHAAVAHAQFETIHPYPDGNGRIGRALLTGHLGRPVSVHLARNRQAYYDALRDYRLGDATPPSGSSPRHPGAGLSSS